MPKYSKAKIKMEINDLCTSGNTKVRIINKRSCFNMASKEKELNNKPKKEVAKKYEQYVKQFTPRPKYFSNSLKAFLVGGLICMAALYIQNMLVDKGLSEKSAGAYVTVILICLAQLLTGLGVFDTISKFAGAGVIVPITGFANSMVAPAIEYKKEGPVLGIGAKLFSIAGPVLVCGISVSVIIGIISYFMR
jgi:stage V sporulation protein AC